MINRFTKKAESVISHSKQCAQELFHSYIGTEHLLLGILGTECVGSRLLEEKKVYYKDVFSRLTPGNKNSAVEAESLTPKFKKIIEESYSVSLKFNNKLIGSEHILYAICQEVDCVGARLLISLGISLNSLKNEICSYLENFQGKKSTSTINGCPILSSHGKNLNQLASQGKYDPLIGREDEVMRLIQILSRRTKNNPCLVGEPGVGKTAIVEGLAQKINDGDVPRELEGKIIVSLDLSSMVAGAKYRGEFEERMKGVMNELKSNPQIILFIDEIHTIIGAGAAEGAVDAANIIKPALSRGQIQLIGATTISEYRRHIEKDAALERRFQPVLVNEPSKEKALDILFGIRDKYEEFHGVKISDEAIYSAVSLSTRYLNDRFLPDKAIDLIDEGCSLLKMSHFSKSPAIKELEDKIKALSKEKEAAIASEGFELASRLRDEEMECRIKHQREMQKRQKQLERETPILTGEHIARVVTMWTEIPVSRIDESESDKLCSLEDSLSALVIGQADAIKTICASIKRSRTGFKSHKRPVGSYLFLGPTGVGKTQLAKSLATVMFGGEDALIRIDMSEYMEKHSISRLIGSPPGYIGYDEGGQLTSKVRLKPYSVVLFDEIEKAHPEVYNLLLQILDEGSLTDSQGRCVDFKNTIIILTSNVGAKRITEAKRLGFVSNQAENEDMKARVGSELKNTFNPEFLNRLDEIVIFNQLTLVDTKKICELMLGEVKALALEIGVNIAFDDQVYEHIAKESFDKAYGARPIRRAIMSLVENPLSEKLLTGEIKAGDSVTVDLKNEKICFLVEIKK
ncbi:MAG: ATP-dependent Clp protease ATP-binding subunit [Clostridia bacterium]|nr:ATP-dependent Clp protease ATP-binding subunit [Clostridia bacterium]